MAVFTPGWISGFFHPARDGKGRSGVVLCNPFGSEQNSTYRCYRHIAEQLSFAGVNVLRFDYYGTGNSPGADAEPSVVRAWLDSIHGAIDFLTDAAETEDLYLFGTRLGATLAAAVASERCDGTIKGLALWYPFDNGGDFSREILFAQKASSRQGKAEGTPARPPNTVREVSGFLLTDAMIEDLRRVDLLSIHRRPAPSALVLARRPSLPETRLVDHLRSLSVQTEHEFIPGITETMGAPDQTALPTAVIERVTNWIVDLSCSGTSGGASSLGDYRLRSSATDCRAAVSIDVDDSVRETALRFGDRDTLFGIVSEPRRQSAGEKPGIVFINPGAVHSTGANRLYVTMARHYAAYGYPVMRFDFSGIGDSSVPGDPEPMDQPLRPKVLQRERDGFIGRDILDAMNVLGSRCGAGRFVLFGMCSSARMAFHAAFGDRRVIGAMLTNAPFFDVGDSLSNRRAADASFNVYRQRVGDWRTWGRILRGEVDFVRAFNVVRVRGRRTLTYWAHRAVALGKPISAAAAPARSPIEEVCHRFVMLSERGVRPWLLYTEHDVGIDYAHHDLGDTLRHLGIDINIFEGADHDVSRRSDQARLIELFSEYLRQVAARQEPIAATSTSVNYKP